MIYSVCMGKKKFNKSNELSTEFGDNLRFVMEYEMVEGYAKTCSALQDLAEMNNNISDKQKQSGNFAPFMDKLMDVFDTYIRETNRNKNRKRKTGDPRNFKPHNVNDVTLALAWQLRHVLNHKGGVVDQGCCHSYCIILSKVKNRDILDKLCLPESVEIGDKVEIEYDTFVKIQNSFYDYLERRHNPEEMNVFRMRGSIFVNNVEGFLFVPFETYFLQFKIEDIISVGGKVDPKTMMPIFPCKTWFIPRDKLLELENGKIIPAIPVPSVPRQHLRRV
jgi:hypothetical protein